jgi:NAD(P)-dependent dehydrogenase (short-subunit alcohol dehydrogenase family)
MDGRVALVTGASSGMGRATAVELARRGARVMAVARREDRLAVRSAETGVQYVACDLSSVEGCQAAVAATRERLAGDPAERRPTNDVRIQRQGAHFRDCHLHRHQEHDC